MKEKEKEKEKGLEPVPPLRGGVIFLSREKLLKF